MDLQQFINVLRVRWKFIVVTLILGILISGGFALSTAPAYESSGRVFIVVPSGSQADAFPTLLVTQRASSYAALAKDPILLRRVREQTGLEIPISKLANRITASVLVDTQIIEITATGTTPEEARFLAEAEIQQLLSLVKEVERPSDGQPAAVAARTTGTPALNSTPVGAPSWLTILVGVLLSFLVGVMGAVLRDRLDQTIKERADVEAATGVAVISALPLDSSVAKDKLSVVRPNSPLAEGFRVLRSNLRFADLDSRGQMILVTSALANEGKTLTAVNLAKSLAATGQSVLLIDCDLRSPSVAANLGLENNVGMLSVLLNQVTLSDAIQFHSEGLNVLPTGPRPPNPSDVLETEAVGNLLSSVRDGYDAIVIDASPILLVADTASLVRHVDGVLLLARFGRTRKEVLRLASERIVSLGGRQYGVVLNGIPRRAGGGYGYGYGYGYGGDYRSTKAKTQRPARGNRRRAGGSVRSTGRRNRVR